MYNVKIVLKSKSSQCSLLELKVFKTPQNYVFRIYDFACFILFFLIAIPFVQYKKI